MKCLQLHRDDSTVCRQEAKTYLECRMNNDLMAKEEWKSLGYHDKPENQLNNEQKHTETNNQTL